MDFLPVTHKGERVYAGFWKRLGAGMIDALILAPLMILLEWLKGFDAKLAIVITIPWSILFAMYNVYFHARLGGTPGKLAVGVRVTRPDGTPIGWLEAWKRSSVDLVFAFLSLVVGVWAFAHVDPARYASLGWGERTKLLRLHQPSWFGLVDYLSQAWIWSEVVVLLFNRRKRAIHDFIAGTVVVHKKFARRRRR